MAQPHADDSQSPATQSLEDVHNFVLEYLKQKVDQNIFEPEFNIRKISTRLTLPACETPLQLEDRNQDKTVGRMSIGVECSSPKWRIYVPAEVTGKLPLVYTNMAIFKGSMIKPEQVREELVPYNQIPKGAAVKTKSVVGMRAKRSISANQFINVAFLQPPYWVFKNHSVNIITQIGDIEVKSFGTALMSGVEGQQIEVRNNRSKKVIRGIVIAPNTVLIP